MKVICLSASNVKHAKENSTSTKVCDLIKEMIEERRGNEIEVKIIPLVDYSLKPCTMCGECGVTNKCTYDQSFNVIYSELMEADGIFIVSPHYAPVPSKLVMVLEKLEEICYLSYCNQEEFSLNRKLVGIIGHGGSNADGIDQYYTETLVTPLARVFRSMGLEVVSAGENWTDGAVFGVEGYTSINGTLPQMVHDWKHIRERVTPLVENVLEQIS